MLVFLADPLDCGRTFLKWLPGSESTSAGRSSIALIIGPLSEGIEATRALPTVGVLFALFPRILAPVLEPLDKGFPLDKTDGAE